MNGSRRWIRAIIALGALFLALVLCNLVSLRLSGQQHQIAIGFRADRHFISGFYKQEADSAGARYRWTRSESEIQIARFVAVQQPFLTLAIGGIPGSVAPPRLVHLRVDGAEWLTLPVQQDARRYTLLLPPGALHDGDLRLSLRSEATSVYPDPREVGIRLDSVTLGWSAAAWPLPTWQTLAVQWALVVIVLAGGWRLGLPRWWRLAAAGGGCVLLAAMTGYDPFVAATWQQRLLVALLVVLLLVWAIFPRLAALLPGNREAARAELRTLVLLVLLVLGVRLLAALYPTFDSHDWYIHEDRLRLFQYGSLLLFDKPAEFSSRLAIVPPAFYVLVAPFTLLTIDTVPTTQGVYVFLDGCAALLLALFVRQMGGSARAARLALLAMAFLPIQFTALWWGFGPQVIGQALFLLMVVLVAHHGSRPPVLWLAAGVVFCMLILTHNGVALLGGFWLAGYVALVWLFQRQQRAQWWGWGALIVACGLAALVLLYIDVVALQLRGVAGNDRLPFTQEDIFRVKYTLGSMCRSFLPLSVPCDQFLTGLEVASVPPQLGVTLLGTLLPLLCLVVVFYRARGLYRWLVLAWLGSAGLFFAVDLASGLQVRYAYFIVPLVCAGLALTLDRLIARHRLGWLVAACLLGLIITVGLTLWYEGVVLALKPSLRLLTH